MGHNDNSLLTRPFEGHNNDTASATETIDNFFSMPEDKLAEKIKETTPPQLIDHKDTVSPDTSQNLRDNIVPEDTDLAGVLGRSAGNVLFPAGGGTIGETIAENTERVTGGGVTEPIDDTADKISSGIDNTVDNVADGIDNTVDNATPDLSGLGGFADKVLIGLALTLVAAAAASSVFN